MSRNFFITLVIVIAGLAGVFWFSSQKTHAPSSSAMPSNHVVGKGTTGVSLIEYGDFQCPACGAYYPIVKKVEQHFGDKIIFQFRNFPLIQLHPNAMAAHRAAEAASNQGKFWEMHDLLYQNQQAWVDSPNPTPFFEAYAAQLGVDISRFRQDVNSESTNNTINADIEAGQKIGATSTPTFVLDGNKIEQSPRSVADFIKLIDSSIKSKTAGQ